MKSLNEIFNSAIAKQLTRLIELEEYTDYKNAYHKYLVFLQRR